MNHDSQTSRTEVEVQQKQGLPYGLKTVVRSPEPGRSPQATKDFEGGERLRVLEPPEPLAAAHFTYHEIATDAGAYVYSIRRELFEEHAAVFAQLGPEQAGMSFDDGHESFHRYGLPVLAKHKVRATHFITAGWAGRREGYMNWAALAELVSAGQRIGSHTWSHPFLNRCNDSELRDELTRSKGELEQRLGIPVCSISIPGGRWDSRVLKACANAGYQAVYTSDPFGPRTCRNGVQVAGRFMVHRGASAAKLRKLASTGFRPWSAGWLVDRTKRTVRLAIGDAAYHHLWRVLGSAPVRGRQGEVW